MKFLLKIALVVCMFAMLAGAFVLPKFAQKQRGEISPEMTAQWGGDVAGENSGSDAEADALAEALADLVNPVGDASGAAPLPRADLFFAAIDAGDFKSARAFLNGLRGVDESFVSGLRRTLTHAETNQKALEASEKRLETARLEMESIKEGGTKQAAVALNEIRDAARMAQRAALEAAELREELRVAKGALAQSGNSLAATRRVEGTKPKVLPEPVTVSFGFDSAVVTEQQLRKLDQVVEELIENPQLRIQVRGFADGKGNSSYNAMLSQARAENVKDALIRRGVDQTLLSAVAFGESMATADGDGDLEDEELRRVEVRFQ